MQIFTYPINRAVEVKFTYYLHTYLHTTYKSLNHLSCSIHNIHLGNKMNQEEETFLEPV
jgi:hypothetical protein